jgi:hypothetical protein
MPAHSENTALQEGDLYQGIILNNADPQAIIFPSPLPICAATHSNLT